MREKTRDISLRRNEKAIRRGATWRLVQSEW